MNDALFDISGRRALITGSSRGLFRGRLGRTPMAFVRWLRLRQVELLLKTSDLTVTEISSRVGIASPFHVSRLFKAQYGVAPSDYRRRVVRLP